MSSVSIFGCSPDTGNLGVTALGYAMISALGARVDARIGIYGHSVPTMRARYPAGSLPAARFFYARLSRRAYDPRSMASLRVSARLGGLTGAGRWLRGSGAVIDISGGDSFADLYGPDRFHFICEPKRMALELGIPLLLPPQTYGPFEGSAARAEAARLVRGASHAWARDERSFEVLKELLGSSFDPARHRSGVDVAFLLPIEPWNDVPEPILGWIADDRPVAGLNISGLIWNDPERARERFGLRIDYARTVRRLVERLVREGGARVVLVPHVIEAAGHYESDPEASERLVESLDAEVREHVAVAPDPRTPGRAKSLISRLDWFCGTRMHATIAGLSSGVPTATISYSPKARGVFECAGQGEWVADPSSESEDGVLDRVWRSWAERDRVRASLAGALPGVMTRANAQIDAMAEVCAGGSPGVQPS